jgi:cell shape-determining protein MreC
MLNQLFLDSLQALSGELQTNLIHLITHPTKLSHKMETLSMEILSFKSQVFNIIANLINNTVATLQTINNPYSKLVHELKEEVQIMHTELFRYRLHHILKKKMAKKRRESSLNSSLRQPNEDLSEL